MIEKFANKYRIKSTRWTDHNYNFGIYYITICTKYRRYSFGSIKTNHDIASITYNKLGEYTISEIENTKIIRKGMDVSIPLYVVMPNHIHLIICIDNDSADDTPLKFGPQSQNLASIIRGIKSKITSFAHKNGYKDFEWQSGFYDRVIRDNRELNVVAEYIENNIEQWSMDKYCIE